jgi:hypothetical protein
MNVRPTGREPGAANAIVRIIQKRIGPGWATRLAMLSVSFVCVSCRRELTPEQRDRWHADSVQYLSVLEQYIRDSSRADSIVRTGFGDSLTALYRNMLRSRRPADYPQPIQCEFDRLSRRYGTSMAGEIEVLVKARVLRELTDSAIDAANSRLPALVAVGDLCGPAKDTGPNNDTVLVAYPIERPLPPRRPW